MLKKVPEIRILTLNRKPVNPTGQFVLYWMVAFRRPNWNFSLDRAIEWAQELQKPLIVVEDLRCDYPWASNRLHAFILDGMRDNAAAFEGSPVLYYPLIERMDGQGKLLFSVFAAHACVIITDDFPDHSVCRIQEEVSASSHMRLEAVDSNGLIPIRATERVFHSAFAFRKFFQEQLPDELGQFPMGNPIPKARLASLQDMPEDISSKWPAASRSLMDALPEALDALPIDHKVAVVELRGGYRAAAWKLREFLDNKINVYHIERNHPDEEATSGLSPFLHFGHISSHQVFRELVAEEDWSPDRLSPLASGKRSGWWGMGEGAEAFLDQITTWRELGFNMCSKRADYDRFDSLPEWALSDLLIHQSDPRPHIYSLDEFEHARTHDPVWNAAQHQLLERGGIDNYLRMLWGKKILEWSPSPMDALHIMIELNNKYALDGRGPNSYTGIFWILGRYDRPFGPSRPIFGRIRYMSSHSTIRKLKMQEYMLVFGS